MCNNNSINSDEKSSVLIDKTKSGKIRPWREKKMANVDYFELLHILEFKKAERVKDCAEVLEYKVSYETEKKRYIVCGFVNLDYVQCATGGEQKSMVFSHKRLLDRKSTRLNSSHVSISYAVFCLKKKKI